MSTTNPESAYNYKVVRQFAIMTVVWGIVGMTVGVLIAAQLVWPDLNFGLALDQLRPPAAAAYQPGDLRLRRLRAVRHQLLRGAAHLPGTPVLRHPRLLHLLGLAAGGDPAGHACRWANTSSKEYAEIGVHRSRSWSRWSGSPTRWCSSAPWSSARSSTSMWATGSSAGSSSPSRCSTW